MDTLDFPTITPEALATPATVVAKANAITESITNVQGEVAKFDAIAAGLRAIEDAHPKNVIVGAINTAAGMKLAEAGWRAYRNPRLEVERARKAAKAPVLALGRAIDTFAGDLEDRLREGERHYRSQIDNELERQAKERAEAERIAREAAERHAGRLATIAAYLIRCQELGMTAERIQKGMDLLAQSDLTDPVPARAVELADAQCRTLEAMRKLHAQAVSREQEAARQEGIRLENERAARELEQERQRIAAEAAEVRRQAAALEADQRRLREAAAPAPAPAVTPAAFMAADPGPVPRVETPADLSAVATALLMPRPAVPPEDLPMTGTPSNHLAQDLHRGLSDALASKPDAMLHAREAAAVIAPPADPRDEFVRLVMSAFAGKFLSHPKPEKAWWDKVREAGQALLEAR